MRIFLLFLLLSSLSFGQDLTCFSENGKYGFKRGNVVVIQPQYEYADHFREGRAAVELDKKWGFIDETGKMIVEPKYLKVEAFSNGYAKFYENLYAAPQSGKFGLIDKNGKVLVPAICTSTSLQRDCYVYHVGRKMGWIGNDGKTVIEPIYDEIGVSEYFVQAVKSDESIDIYSRSGEMIAASAAEPSMILDEFTYSKYIDVQWTQETRILDQNGKQVGPAYTDIEKLECSQYNSTGESGYEYYFHNLFKLNIPLNNNGSNVGTFHILMTNGRFFNDNEYTDFYSNDERTTVQKNELTYELNRSGEFVASKYKRIDELYNCSVLTLTDGTAQIAEFANFYADTSIIATFSSVRLLLLESDPVVYNGSEDNYGGNADSDYGNWNYEIVTPFHQTVVEVEGMNGNKGKFALFSLLDRSLITPYGNSRLELSVCEDLNKIYIYKDSAGVIGASLAGQIYEPKYFSFVQLSSWGYVFRDSLDHQYFYSCSAKNMMAIPDNVNVLVSNEYLDSDPIHYDEETGESYYFYPEARFQQSFVLLQSMGEHSKFGFIDGAGKMVLPQFDSISDRHMESVYNPDFPVLYTYLNGKYGAYEYYTSKNVPPVYSQPLQFNSQDFPGIQVCYFIEDGYALTIDNKKLYARAAEPFVEKQGKYYGLKDYFNFLDIDSAFTVIPPLYKEFKEDFDTRGVAIAKGQNNKWGVLSTFGGDTLVPFEYTNIEWTEEYYSTSEYADGASWYKLYKGKKVGLYVPRFGRYIPAIYDRIELNELTSGEMFGPINSLQVFIGEKTGLYTDDLKEIFPCEFDGIIFIQSQERMVFLAQKGEKYIAFPYYDALYNSYSEPRYQFDLILENQGLRKTEKGYDSYSIGYTSFLRNVKDTLTFDSENLSSLYQPIIKNGLIGINTVETNEVALPPTRKMIEFLDDYFLFEFKKGETYYSSMESPKKVYKFNEY